MTDSSFPASVRTFERAAEGEDLLRPFRTVVAAGDTAFQAEVEHTREAILRVKEANGTADVTDSRLSTQISTGLRRYTHSRALVRRAPSVCRERAWAEFLKISFHASAWAAENQGRSLVIASRRGESKSKPEKCRGGVKKQHLMIIRPILYKMNFFEE